MLEGKTVRISDVGLLLNFYPDYIEKKELFFDGTTKVIYTGKPRKKLKEYLSDNTLSFINTVGPYDYDLNDRETLLDLALSKHGRKRSDSILDVALNMSEDEFIINIKILWLTGKLGSIEDLDYSIFDLYKNLTKSKKELLSIYFELSKAYNPRVIEASLFTFFEKSFDKDIEVSPGYRKILDSFRDRRGDKLKPLLNKYRSKRFSSRDVSLRLMWLLLNI